MRRTGFVDTVEGLGRHDHICWMFATSGEFRAAASSFLAEGIADGQRVLYIAGAADERDLDGVEGFAAARLNGGAQVLDMRVYGTGEPVDPAEQVRAYAQATNQAMADGYTGLRVAADVTPMVLTQQARDAFARYEHMIDAYTTQHPFSAMCAYNRDVLGREAVAELACMHSLARRSSTTLRLHATDQAGIALAGEVDITVRAQLDAALARTALGDIGGEIAVDATELTFIDHRGLIQVVEHIRSRGASTVLRVGDGSMVRSLAGLLRLPDLQVVVS